MFEPNHLPLVSFAAFLLVGEMWPKVSSRRPRLRRWPLNTLIGVVGMALTGWAWGHAGHWLGQTIPSPAWLQDLPIAAQCLATLLVLDLALYFWHRANHESAFLWRFHAFHHRDEELDATTSLRFHPVELLLSGFWRVPLAWFLGADPWAWAWASAIIPTAAAFHHSRFFLPPRLDQLASAVLVTPRWHWGHHHPERRFHDAQYGVVFSWWDRLFRTVSLPPDHRIGLEET